MRWRLILLFLVLITLNSVIAADITQTQDISNFAWQQGNDLDNALQLEDYFSSTAELRFTYQIEDPTTSISPITIEITADSAGEVNFKNTDSSFVGEKYIKFIAYENETSNLTSNTVMLNITKQIEQNETTGEKTLNITSFSPISDSVSISQGDTQSFSIIVVSSGVSTIKWYVNNILKSENNEKTFLYSPNETGTFPVKVLVELSQLSQQQSWTLTVSEKISGSAGVSPGLTEEIVECGNKIKETGENCETCPEDVQCASNAECRAGICVPLQQNQSSPLLKSLITPIIALVVLVLLGVGVFFLYKKRLFNKFKKQNQIEQDTKQQVTSKLDLSALKSYLSENLKKGFSLEQLKKAAMGRGWTKEQIDQAMPSPKKSNIDPLKNYIKENLKKGYSKSQLEQATINAGWTKEQVTQAFKEINNDNIKGNTPNNRKIN